MKKDKKIIVFLGPTLAQEDAKMICPNAHYVAPIKCGDILHLLREKPNILAIIDGYFEQTAAVWHKEILYAMQQGVTLYGASSMGALRAAELHQYGMHGVGEIFKQYKEGVLEADDEVAIAHLDGNNNYQALSDAMVNIRSTLDAALDQSIVSEHRYREILNDLEKRPYFERNLMQYLEQFQALDEIRSLKCWLKKNKMVDQKRLDAVALLSYLAKEQQQKAAFTHRVPSSMFFKALQHKTQSDLLDTSYNWMMCQKSKNVVAIQPSSQNLMQVKRLAALLSVTYQLSRNDPMETTPSHYLLPSSSKYCEVISVINCLINQAKLKREKVAAVKKYFSIIDGLDDSEEEKLSHYSAVLWTTVMAKVESLNFTIQENEVLTLSSKFRKSKELLTSDSFDQWLRKNALSLDEYQEMIISAYWFDFIVARFNINILVEYYRENNHWWFDIASEITKTGSGLEAQ